MFLSRAYRAFWIAFALSLGAAGCGAPEMNCDSESGRSAIVQAVDNALNVKDCASAISAIDPYYDQSGCATDEIRYAKASAYACAANLDFFGLIEDLPSANLSGTAIWQTFPQLFPSTLYDGHPTAAGIALDALFAIRNPGDITPTSYQINRSTPHVGSLLVGSRKDQANFYGMLTSMALLGSIQSQYGSPDPNNSYKRRQVMGGPAGDLTATGWMSQQAVSLNQDACAFAGGLLTFVDNTVDVALLMSTTLGASVASNLSNQASVFNVAFNTACDLGCRGAIPAPANNTGCAFPTGTCSPCPITLRDRTKCTLNSRESCAAAGLMYFVHSGAGWQP